MVPFGNSASWKRGVNEMPSKQSDVFAPPWLRCAISVCAAPVFPAYAFGIPSPNWHTGLMCFLITMYGLDSLMCGRPREALMRLFVELPRLFNAPPPDDGSGLSSIDRTSDTGNASRQ